MCSFISLTLGILLSEERGCTLNFTCILDVADFPSRFIRIFLPTAAALSALTTSSTALVNPRISVTVCPDQGQRGFFPQPFEDKFNSFSVSLHPCFGKIFVKWTVILDALFHAVINVGKVVKGLYPVLVARVTIPHPPSNQSTF